MLKYLPELLSGLFLAKEIGEASRAHNYWETAYHSKCNELFNTMQVLKQEQEYAKSLRDEVVMNHNHHMDLMAQNQELEKEKHNYFKTYLALVAEIEDLGWKINDEGKLEFPGEEALEEEEEEEEEEVNDLETT